MEPTGDELNAMPVVAPEQIVCNGGVAIAVGIGFTVITTSIGEPTQPFKVGVTVYVTVPTAVDVELNT